MQDRIGVVTRCHKFSLGQAGVIVDGGKGVSKLRHGSSGWVKDSPDFLIALLWSIKFSNCWSPAAPWKWLLVLAKQLRVRGSGWVIQQMLAFSLTQVGSTSEGDAGASVCLCKFFEFRVKIEAIIPVVSCPFVTPRKGI